HIRRHRSGGGAVYESHGVRPLSPVGCRGDVACLGSDPIAPENTCMTKTFASTGDLTEKKITFAEIGRDLYAFTADGDPNSGVIVGADGVVVIGAQATPAMAQLVFDRVRQVTDKPIKYVVLSHYHAVRVLGASAYKAQEVVSSEKCRAMIAERGQ